MTPVTDAVMVVFLPWFPLIKRPKGLPGICQATGIARSTIMIISTAYHSVSVGIMHYACGIAYVGHLHACHPLTQLPGLFLVTDQCV